MTRKRRFFATTALVLVSALANAQTYGVLKDAPASYFDDADLQLFQQAWSAALDHGVVNKAIAWENPKTRHRGDVTVLREFESKQRPCKQLRVRNEAHGLKSNVRFDLCTIDGQWKLVTQSEM